MSEVALAKVIINSHSQSSSCVNCKKEYGYYFFHYLFILHVSYAKVASQIIGKYDLNQFFGLFQLKKGYKKDWRRKHTQNQLVVPVLFDGQGVSLPFSKVNHYQQGFQTSFLTFLYLCQTAMNINKEVYGKNKKNINQNLRSHFYTKKGLLQIMYFDALNCIHERKSFPNHPAIQGR